VKELRRSSQRDAFGTSRWDTPEQTRYRSDLLERSDRCPFRLRISRNHTTQNKTHRHCESRHSRGEAICTNRNLDCGNATTSWLRWSHDVVVQPPRKAARQKNHATFRGPLRKHIVLWKVTFEYRCCVWFYVARYV
jgi:hypothetical protein